MKDNITVATYYFPNYHPDARNARQHGPGWSEWELVKRAEPRFSGHQQPRVPSWGYTDESDPDIMEMKINAATDHGIDVFIYDWYWYNDGPFLERGLEEGFMKAPNSDRMQFGIMWANHDWINIHPAKLHTTPQVLYPGSITPETFDVMTDHIINHYFSHPSYWKIAGCPYFSVYELFRMIEGFGGLEKTRAALDIFRKKTRAAGFPDLHLNGVTWGIQLLPGEQTVSNPAELVSYLNFQSVTSYVWIHQVALGQFPETPYTEVMEKAGEVWRKSSAEFPVPYHPNVTVGWDASPRTVQSDVYLNAGYPFMPMLGNNTPENFKKALEEVHAFIQQQPEEERIFSINAWNEWTEGSYLEPDTVHGYAYLEAIRDTFGR